MVNKGHIAKRVSALALGLAKLAAGLRDDVTAGNDGGGTGGPSALWET